MLKIKIQGREFPVTAAIWDSETVTVQYFDDRLGSPFSRSVSLTFKEFKDLVTFV